MADVSNRDEADRCKEIARTALAAGDAEKAVRVLLKAKRMCPSDASIDGLIAQVQSGGFSGSSSAGSRGGPPDGAAPEGMRQRPAAAAAPGAARSGKDGAYTADQMRLVQRILRTRDYYEVLEIDRRASEDAIKKAYKKIALKLHPDKNKAPGAEEAFKKLSKATQCLTDAEKRDMYGRYGDEDRIPQQHRHRHEQEFMTPNDLFNIFFGGGLAPQQRGGQSPGHTSGNGNQQSPMFQVICMVVVLLTMSSGLVGRDNSANKFSFSRSVQYHVERSTATADVTYFVTDAWDELHPDGTRAQAEFENLVEVNHIRTLVNDCEYQKLMGRRRAKSGRPACEKLEEIQTSHRKLYRSAMR